nr:replication factor C subunit 4 [Paratrimastix eleionoma]
MSSFAPWVEKYRPKNLSEVFHQEEALSSIRQFISTGNLPHLLFYGPPGTGKTSTFLAAAHELFGPDLIKSRLMELNASDERGIQVIREKVKTFAQGAVAQKASDCPYPCPPFKLILLDEADALTPDAQSALRRTMEQYAKSTRFCLICNYISRIIEPLSSRCAKFRFQPLPIESACSCLQRIIAQEGITCTDEVVRRAVEVSEGDLRRAITLLQSAYRLSLDHQIVPSIFTDLAGLVTEERMAQMMSALHSNGFENLNKLVETFIADGFPVQQFLTQFLDRIVEDPDLSDVKKSEIAYHISETEKALQDGANEQLQLLALTSFAMTVICRRSD